MWNKPTDRQLSKMPNFYETEDVPTEDKIIHQHYFLGASDWYMAEYSPKERMFFGYAILNNDHQNAEWGYSSLQELIEINIRGIEVDRELHWKLMRFGDIEKIHRKH